jgi:hypothetical protein
MMVEEDGTFGSINAVANVVGLSSNTEVACLLYQGERCRGVYTVQRQLELECPCS